MTASAAATAIETAAAAAAAVATAVVAAAAVADAEAADDKQAAQAMLLLQTLVQEEGAGDDIKVAPRSGTPLPTTAALVFYKGGGQGNQCVNTRNVKDTSVNKAVKKDPPRLIGEAEVQQRVQAAEKRARQEGRVVAAKVAMGTSQKIFKLAKLVISLKQQLDAQKSHNTTLIHQQTALHGTIEAAKGACSTVMADWTKVSAMHKQVNGVLAATMAAAEAANQQMQQEKAAREAAEAEAARERAERQRVEQQAIQDNCDYTAVEQTRAWAMQWMVRAMAAERQVQLLQQQLAAASNAGPL